MDTGTHVALVCRRGHCYRTFTKKSAWSAGGAYGLSKRCIAERRVGCLCGEREVIALYYTKKPNDCQSPGDMAYRGTEPIAIRIPDAVDRDGDPIEAFRLMDVECWDISGLKKKGAFKKEQLQAVTNAAPTL